MKSQISLIAQQARLNEWGEQIKECQNRSQGMKIDEWCQLHGIKKLITKGKSQLTIEITDRVSIGFLKLQKNILSETEEKKLLMRL